MSAEQLHRIVNVITGIAVVVGLLAVPFTVSTIRNKSVWQYMLRVRQDQAGIDAAQKAYRRSFTIAAVLWVMWSLGAAWRLVYYVKTGI